jgi:hypothetical protein
MTELEIALALLYANSVINSPEYWENAINTEVFDSAHVQQLILNMADYVENNPAMKEILKRWNGTTWVTVARLNRVEVIGTGESTGILDHPKIGSPVVPYSDVNTINTVNGLNHNYSYVIE